MRPSTFALVSLTLKELSHLTNAQTCSGIQGPFSFQFAGSCNYDTILEEYTRQVFDAAGNLPGTCGSVVGGETSTGLTAKDDLDAKLAGTSVEEICNAAYDSAEVTEFHNAARQGTDYHFEQMFYNGRSHWQEEVETLYESVDGTATSILKQDAKAVDDFYRADGTHGRVEWPNMLTNFDDATCTMNAAMCCWPKDRQANDNNGNCAKPYDLNCVDKDPADNTDLCYVDMEDGSASNEFGGDGFAVFPGDNNGGEGAIHCHGFAWANDEYDSISRYKANNLFYVSMYDHMYQRGYVENIPGAPMCGCLDQMPIVSRSDCTQVDLEEEFKLVFDGTDFAATLIKSEIDFNACRGINNRNNDLWAYSARLYEEGRMTNEQFGQVGRTITDNGCDHAVAYEQEKKGLTTGFMYDLDAWTKVAGRDALKEAEPFGREAFNAALFKYSLTAPSDLATETLDNTPILMRVCATCTKTHKKIYYRRLTPIDNEKFDLLDNLIYQRNNGGGDNVWNVDFTMHSTYEDALTGVNPWKCPGDAYNYGDGFPGQCSPTGARVKDQDSIFNWLDNTKTDVAWFVNKPADVGVQDLIDNPNTRSDGFYADIDIGDVNIEGNTLEHNGVYHITASGKDIWNQADTFHYHSQPGFGDVDVSAHLSSFANIRNQHAKAGIMLRADHDDNSEYIFALMTGSRGLYLQGRSSKGNYAKTYGSNYATNPVQTAAWLRLVKKMDLVEMYRSDDGVEWTLHASANIFFPNDTFRIGLAVTSHDNRYLSEATFEDYQINEYFFPTSSPSISSAPTVWEPAVDVGDVQRAGSITEPNADGVARVYGSGTGTWGHNDAFFFHNVQKSVGGALEVNVHVNNFSYHYQYGKGGIMIRDSNDPDAANAFIAIAGRNQGVVFQSREEAGSPTTHHSFDWIQNNDVWLKLTKEADSSVVTASYKHSSDTEWTVAGATSLMLTGETVQVGLAVTAGDAYQHALAQLDYKEYDVVES
eukprot:g8069.t1 g8069   contig27:117931-121073(+)